MAKIEQSELARRAGVSTATIKRLEAMNGPVVASVATLVAVVKVLEKAGVVFVDENGEGPGVRLRKQ